MSSATPIDTPKLVLDSTMGAQLIGVLLAAGLYGVSCLQTWCYFGWYPKDRWYLKSLVIGCWFFDTVHQALITHTIYIYLVKNFNNPTHLNQLVWSLLAEVLFNGFTALLTQSFYTFRIYRLSGGKIWLTGIVVALIVAEFVSVVVYTIQSLQLDTFVQLTTLKHLSMVVNILAAAGDVLIASILCTMLNIQRTGFKKSDTMINKLMVFVVNTGLLTSVCAVMSLVSIVVWPNAFIYICFFFMLGRLYSNSLLAALNARKGIRSGNYDSDGFALSMPTFTSTIGGSRRRHGDTNKSLTVMVETVKECDSEERLGKLRFASDGSQDRDSQLSIDGPFTPDDSPRIPLPNDKGDVEVAIRTEGSEVVLVRRGFNAA